MAQVPANCELIRNDVGTAAAMWFEYKDTTIVSMPGVPYEMKDFMKKKVLPRLAERSTRQIIHKTLMTAGIGESIIADKISDIEEGLPEHIKLAYLPRIYGVRLRLSGAGVKGQLEQELSTISKEIQKRLPKYFYVEDDTTLEAWLGKYLGIQGKTLSTAESCTGGNIARLMTKNPGASAFYQGSILAYSNALKVKLLGVSEKTLDDFGAVSEQTVIEMARGALNLLGTDFSIAVSGVAGPSGGTEIKPVGTVWVAVGKKEGEIMTQKYLYPGNREMVIQGTTQAALNQLRKFIFGLA